MGSLGVLLAYLSDLIFGDPEWFPHPVRGIGSLINFLEKRLNVKPEPWAGRIRGAILALIVVGTSAFLAYLFIKLSGRMNPFLGSFVWIYLGYAALSVKDLRVKALAVLKELKSNSLKEARRQLSRIVGRDTQGLSEEKIIKATVESIAENTNDGIVAPLFYLIVGGPVTAIAYKAVNTLDSMIGHKRGRYIHFGWFSARLDDAANFIPARITGFLISISSLILGKNFKDSFKIMKRDGRKHPSPNSGISEAAMAGALGIRLGGNSSYQGRISAKPYLGEDKKPVRASFINAALVISLVTSILMLSMGALLKWLI